MTEKDYTMTFDEIKQRMETSLPQKRFSHVISVVEEVQVLADIFGADREALTLAALLHDCTKPFSYAEHIAYAEEHTLSLSEDDVRSPEVLHARTGAVMAVKEYGLGEDVFSLIYCHCTAKEDMSLEEKILFLSDYIEKTRTHEICLKTRAEFYSELEKGNKSKTLDTTVLRVLINTVEHLKDKNMFIHSDTLRAIEFLKSEDCHETKKRT